MPKLGFSFSPCNLARSVEGEPAWPGQGRGRFCFGVPVGVAPQVGTSPSPVPAAHERGRGSMRAPKPAGGAIPPEPRCHLPGAPGVLSASK